MKVATILMLLAASAPRATATDATGATLARCLADPANGSTAGQTDCEAAALRDYDRRMNAAYASLIRTLSGPAAQRLRLAQRAWLAFRDGEAAARGALYGTRHGTMYVPLEASAATDVVRDRALQLERDLRVLDLE